jgi:hypothetical protein
VFTSESSHKLKEIRASKLKDFEVLEEKNLQGGQDTSSPQHCISEVFFIVDLVWVLIILLFIKKTLLWIKE